MSGNRESKSPFILRSEINKLSADETIRRESVLRDLSESELESVSGAHCTIHPAFSRPGQDFTIDPTWDPQNGGDSEACDD